MNKKRKIILGIFFIIIIVFTLLKIYVVLFETNFQDLNAKNVIEIQNKLNNDTFSFALVGNVENSIDVFDKEILPLLNNNSIDFVIFAGNSLLDGGKDKYGAFYKTLQKLNIPSVEVVGDNEISDNGAKRFHKYFGPFYFSFRLNNSYFIFLDTTGQTSEEWQKEWLLNELENSKEYTNKFVVSNRPLIANNKAGLILSDNEYVSSKEYVDFLKESFVKYNVTAVLSSNKIGFNSTEIGNIHYLSSGSGGGLLLTTKPINYGFIKAIVSPKYTKFESINLESSDVSLFAKIWKSFWFRLHSWFYIGYINFVLSFSIIFFIVYFIYSKLIETPDFYPKYIKPSIKKKLTIAMFTNNYLPFIGGVPISIFRLKKGLEKQGHKVYVFAPEYPNKTKENNIIHCKPLFYYKKGNLIVPITNILSTKIKKEFLRIKPDVVHVHHPYWLGSVGLKLAKKNNIPVVYTYHTRIEQYNHYLPFFKKLAGGRIPHMLIKKFANSCNAIIAPAESTKEYLRNLEVGKIIRVLPTGVDLEHFNLDKNKIKKLNSLKKEFKNDNEIILFSVFRLSKEKNPYFMLKGIKQIKEKTNLKFKCLIAGTGPEEKNLKKFIEKNNLSDVVSLLGKIEPENISSYYQLADIFIFSSKSETQGMVLLEAMAGSCPVVAVQSSGTDDLIIEGKNGFKTKDNMDEWCNKIIYLIQNKDLFNKISKEAHEFSKKYSIENIASKAIKLYKQILSK